MTRTPDHELPVFAFSPNWKEGVDERLEFKTEILVARSSSAEQRMALRLSPRRQFDARFDLLGAERTFADLFMRRFLQAEFMFPLWHDAATLNATAAIGADTVSIDTTDREFVAGGMAVLMGDDALSFEAVRIAEVSDEALSLVVPLSSQWKRGVRIHPLVRGNFRASECKRSPHTDRFERFDLAFDTNQVNDVDGGEEVLATYAGYPILSPGPDWRQSIDSTVLAKLFEVDGETGLKSLFSTSGRPTSTQLHGWLLEGRADLMRFRRLIYRLQGRRGFLWLPTFTSDLELAAPAATGASQIVVRRCGLDYADFPAPGRSVAISAGGDVIQFAALAASGYPAEERIDLVDPLATALPAGAFLSWIDTARLDTDTIEFQHLTDSDGATRVNLALRTVPDVRDGSEPGALDLPDAAMSETPCGVGAPVDPPPDGEWTADFPLSITVALPNPLPSDYPYEWVGSPNYGSTVSTHWLMNIEAEGTGQPQAYECYNSWSKDGTLHNTSGVAAKTNADPSYAVDITVTSTIVVVDGLLTLTLTTDVPAKISGYQTAQCIIEVGIGAGSSLLGFTLSPFFGPDGNPLTMEGYGVAHGDFGPLVGADNSALVVQLYDSDGWG